MQEDTQTVLSEVWQGGVAIAYFTRQATLDEFKAMYPKGANMDKERIKQMAEEAGFRLEPGMDAGYIDFAELSSFAQLVAEDCAAQCKAVEQEILGGSAPEGFKDYMKDGAWHCQKAIRARYGIKE